MVNRCIICSNKRSSETKFCNDCIIKLNSFKENVEEIKNTMDIHKLDSYIDKLYWTAYELIKIRGIPIK